MRVLVFPERDIYLLFFFQLGVLSAIYGLNNRILLHRLANANLEGLWPTKRCSTAPTSF